MGTIYKIKPEIKEFILKEAGAHPELGCRKLSLLVQAQFKLNISKSSINTILKNGGLSLSVGRRLIHGTGKYKTLSHTTGKLAESSDRRPVSCNIDKPKELECPSLKDDQAAKIEVYPKEDDRSKLLLPTIDQPGLNTDKEALPSEIPGVPEEEAKLLLPSQQVEDLAGRQAHVLDKKPAFDAATQPASPIVDSGVGHGQSIPSQEQDGFYHVLGAPRAISRGAGYWFLKAADLYLGGIQAISGALKEGAQDKKEISELVTKNETLLYMPLFGIEEPRMLGNAPATGLYTLVGRAHSPEELDAYLSYLKMIDSLNILLLNQISSSLASVTAIKFVLNDNSIFFLDAANHSVWSAGHIPRDFSGPASRIKRYLNQSILVNSQPLILQAPPGFEAPTPALFNFIKSFTPLEKATDFSRGLSSYKAPAQTVSGTGFAMDIDKQIKRIELFGVGSELLEFIPSVSVSRRSFIIGSWPWQYAKTLEVIESGALRAFRFGLTGEDFLLSEGKVLLKPPDFQEPVILRSILLRKTQNKASLRILTNIDIDNLGPSEAVLLYLERWPNLESGYQDFLNKVELSSYAINKQAASIVNMAALTDTEKLNLDRILGFWRTKLNEYCQNFLFPLSYRNLDFSIIKERFYELGGETESQIGHFKVRFNVQSGFTYLNDLIYSCQRVNEKDIRLPNGSRLFFEVSKKAA